jgi:hypothetical protein
MRNRARHLASVPRTSARERSHSPSWRRIRDYLVDYAQKSTHDKAPPRGGPATKLAARVFSRPSKWCLASTLSVLWLSGTTMWH